MGDREELLLRAVRMIDRMPGVRVRRSSSLYETDPVGYTEQASFLNLALHIETSLAPAELLLHMQEIEAELGRERIIRWGPRTLDIDILLYGTEWIQQEGLQIPHPRMTERAFVLVPLTEIAPAALIPYRRGAKTEFLSVAAALAEVKDEEGVRRWKAFRWEHME